MRKSPPGPLPEGLTYLPDFLGVDEEALLLAEISRVEFGEIRMHGVTARRRIAHFGWLYSFETSRITPGPPIPDFLLGIREKAAGFAKLQPEELAEALLTEYPPGASIGWHRDAAPFGVVLGISLAAPCRFRFQKGKAAERVTAELNLQPRSLYILEGPARTKWQHHIPPTKELRYSITFRTLRRRR